jgi:hypothetical protein
MKKVSWQEKLRAERDWWRTRCGELEVELRSAKQVTEAFSKIVNAPPTVVIAAEKIVESAAQLALTANSFAQQLIRERR